MHYPFRLFLILVKIILSLFVMGHIHIFTLICIMQHTKDIIALIRRPKASWYKLVRWSQVRIFVSKVSKQTQSWTIVVFLLVRIYSPLKIDNDETFKLWNDCCFAHFFSGEASHDENCLLFVLPTQLNDKWFIKVQETLSIDRKAAHHIQPWHGIK